MTADAPIKAGHAAIEMLARAGVRRAYTVPGESFLEVLDAVERHPEMSLVSTRHESGASFMAEADAKLTGVPAVAMATRGVGASNLAIGVHTARQDSTPMLVLLGQVETHALGREAFQEVDLPDFYAQITKWSATVPRADRVAEFVAKALRIATSGRPGPVMLALPADLLAEDVPAPEERSLTTIPLRPALTPGDAKEIAGRIIQSRRPVLIAGGGTREARDELVAFSEAFDVGVYTGFRRQDRFPNSHPHYLGHLGLGTPSDILRALGDADLVLVVGCRLGEVTTQDYTLPRPDQAVIHMDADPGVAGVVVPGAHGIVADARIALAEIIEHAPSSRTDRDWTRAHGAYLDASEIPSDGTGGRIDPARVIAAMRETLPEDAIITNDAGNFSGFLHRYWRYDEPLTQLAPTNGAMGYGVPAAVAAKLAAPKRCVVACCGDGGFLMSGQEIETAVRHGAGIIVVVFRNGMHGTIAMHQARHIGRTAGTEIGEVDLAGYARSLGAAGRTVRDPDDLIPAFEEALASESVSLLDVVTDPEAITPSSRFSELMPAAHDDGEGR